MYPVNITNCLCFSHLIIKSQMFIPVTLYTTTEPYKGMHRLILDFIIKLQFPF